MSLANDAITVTPGSGATLAMQSPGGSSTTRYPTVASAAAGGDVRESGAVYVVQSPWLRDAANRYYWELFNGSTTTVTLLELAPLYATDQDGARGLSGRFDLYTTTALASSGSAFNVESSSTLSTNISRLDTTDATLPSGITFTTNPTSITTGYFVRTLFLGQNAITSALLESVALDALYRTTAKVATLHTNQGIACRRGTVSSGDTFLFTLYIGVSA